MYRDLLKKGHDIYFVGENLPMNVKAIGKRYAVVVRAIDAIEDEELILDSGYHGIEDCKDSPIYSLLDFQDCKKAPSDRIFNFYDYNVDEDCEQCLADLEAGDIELSRRNGVDLHIDWARTFPE